MLFCVPRFECYPLTTSMFTRNVIASKSAISPDLAEILQIASFYVETMFARKIFADSKVRIQNFVKNDLLF